MRAFVFLSALLTACAFVPQGFIRPSGEYGDALSRATREGEILRDADEGLTVFATCESPAFKEARTRRLARVVGVSIEQARAYGGDLTTPLEGTVFFVAAHTIDASANDFDYASSRWRWRLVTEQGPVAPVRIVRMKSHVEAVQSIYPFVDRSMTCYRVEFPPTAAGGPLTLELAGARNQIRLVFDAEATR